MTLATVLVLVLGILLAGESLRIIVVSSGPAEMSHVALGFEALLVVIPGMLVISFANLYAGKTCEHFPGWVRSSCRTVAILDLGLALILAAWILR